MFQPVTVSLSGPAFSFLVYETCKARLRQEGFLLGEIIHKETTSITDNDQPQISISKIVKINSLIPCPEKDYFDKGKINAEKIKALLGNCFSKVVAWYKFQKVPIFKFTLKNKLIHRQLIDLFKISPDLFTCCFLVTEGSDNLSTYNLSQTFLRYHNGYLDRPSIHIANLSEPNNTYKNSEPASETFNEILGNLKIDLKKSQGLVIVTEIETATQKHIDATVQELAETEKRLFELEEEICILQNQVYEIDDSELDLMSVGNDSPSVSKSTEIDDSVSEKSNEVGDTIESSPETHKTFSTTGRGRGGKKKGYSEIKITETGDIEEISLKRPEIFDNRNTELEETEQEFISPDTHGKPVVLKGRGRGRSRKKT